MVRCFAVLMCGRPYFWTSVFLSMRFVHCADSLNTSNGFSFSFSWRSARPVSTRYSTAGWMTTTAPRSSRSSPGVVPPQLPSAGQPDAASRYDPPVSVMERSREDVVQAWKAATATWMTSNWLYWPSPRRHDQLCCERNDAETVGNVISYYWQACAKRSHTGIVLLSSPKIGFSPRRGDTLPR